MRERSELALMTILDRKTAEESAAILDGLIEEHPDDTYPQVARAMLMIKGKDQHGGHHRVAPDCSNPWRRCLRSEQVLAGVLGWDVETWGEAWERYKAALRSGPLLTTTYKGAAYYLAKRYEPSGRDLILKDASEVERMVIRSRLWGYNFMSYSVVIPAMIAALVGSKALGVGLILMVLTALWGSMVRLHELLRGVLEVLYRLDPRQHLRVGSSLRPVQPPPRHCSLWSF